MSEHDQGQSFFGFFILISTLISGAALSSCVQKMAKEARLRPLEGSPAFLKISRMPPFGTVPQRPYLETIGNPLRPLTRKILEKGRDQFNVFCMPCHGMSGYGDGMVVQRGFLAPPSYHTDRLRNAPDSHFVDVISRGFGAMYSYADRVPVSDRWAILEYIRALQLSQNVDLNQLNTEDRKNLGAPSRKENSK